MVMLDKLEGTFHCPVCGFGGLALDPGATRVQCPKCGARLVPAEPVPDRVNEAPSEPETTPKLPPDPPTLPSLRDPLQAMQPPKRPSGEVRIDLARTPPPSSPAPVKAPSWVETYLSARKDHPNAEVWAPAVPVPKAVEDFFFSVVARSSLRGRRIFEDGIIVFVSAEGGRRFAMHLTELPGLES